MSNSDVWKKQIKLVLGFFFILGIFVTIYDLNISQTFVNKNSGWGIIIEKYGELPGLLIVWFCLATMMVNVLFDYKNVFLCWGIILLDLFIMVLLFQYFLYRGVGSYVGIIDTEGIKEFASNWGNLIFLSSTVISLVLFALLHRLTPNFARNHKDITKIVIWQAAISQLFIQVFKSLWGRVRFRDLDATLSNFNPWYFPQGISGNDSFPSGHTGLGWMLLACAFFIPANQPTARKIVLIITIVWGIVVGMGRICVGAHYASDVWMASFVTVVPFLILYKTFKTKL